MDTRKILDLLEEYYRQEDREAEFRAERSALERLLPPLEEQIAPSEIHTPLGVGSTAIVLKVRNPALHQYRALKVSRPRLGKLSKIIRVIRGERDILLSITHQNIIKIYDLGEVEIEVDNEKYSFPWFLMDFLEDVQDFDRFLFNHHLTGPELVAYMRDITVGLDYLHKSNIIHCDLKPGNILVAPGRDALIADLGYAKKHFPLLDDATGRVTDVTYTPAYAHPDLRERMRRSTDDAANVAEIRREDLRTAFDLYALGKSFQQVLHSLKEKEKASGQALFRPTHWVNLALIAIRLLDGVDEKKVSEALLSDWMPGLPGAVHKEIAYATAEEALEDIEKLLNLYDLAAEIPELNPNTSVYIHQPASQVPLTPRVRRLINHPAISRLTQSSQLGFVSLVYPGATHSRFEHTLGVFDQFCQVVRALWADESNCFFRSVMRKSDIEAVLVAALLHDLGQYPMAHELSEIHSNFQHERFLESLIVTLKFSKDENLADLIESDWDTSADRIVRILQATEPRDVRDRILRSIVSGPLDCDKLDYLIRDGLHLGVSFGNSVDRSRLYRGLTVCIKKKEDSNEILTAEVGVKEKGLAVAREVWRARREMFRQVYWHHSVRALKAMLSFVVRSVLLRLREKDETKDFWIALREFVTNPLTESLSFGDRLRRARNVEGEGPSSEILGFEADPGTSESVVEFGEFSFLSPGDEALMRFLWRFTRTDGERNLLNMIRSRSLFKRAGVISSTDSAFNGIYERHKSDRLAHDLKKIEDFRAEIEEELVSHLTQAAEKEGSASLSEVRNLVERAWRPALLVDIPVKATQWGDREEALWFVPEEELMEAESTIRFPPARKSRIQIGQSDFDKEVGKIRLLVHPEWQAAIASLLPGGGVVEIMRKVMRATQVS